MGRGKIDDMAEHVSGQSNMPLSKVAHALEREFVLKEMQTDDKNGLTEAEATIRLERYGRNELDDGPGVQPLRILLTQACNAIVLVLIIAMAASFAIRSWIEGGVIAAVIFLNIVVGFIQEYRAGKTLESLRELGSPTATIIRDGVSRVIPTGEMVPGDMVELKTGDSVPADLRLLESINFETDEALLTGESLPVMKDEEALFDEDTGPGDRLNIAYSSSTVTKGRARGIAYATGMKTEIGAIAALLRKSDSKIRPVKRREDGSAHPFRYAQSWSLTATDAVGRFLGTNVGTPLQRKLSRLAVLLFGTAIVCAIIVMAANSFSNNAQVIVYAVATGISMLPASLIVVLTISMAVGTRRMVERNVIVRKLDALEALGGVTDICSDKTGTLTQGKMVAKKCWIPSKGTYSVGPSSQPYNPTMGDLSLVQLAPKDMDSQTETHGSTEGAETLLHDNGRLEDFLFSASLANLATVHETDGEWRARGDPTEIAIQVFASRFDFNRSKFLEGEAEWKQVAEYPFDSEVKRMSVIFEHRPTKRQMVFAKGAVERILDSCDKVAWETSEIVEMSKERRLAVLENMEALAKLGLRVLAIASKPYNTETGRRASREGPPLRAEVENELTFCGLIGLYDPPRPESAASVKACHGAGIAVHMLTGDHPGTAKAIATQVGILPNPDLIAKDVVDTMVMTAKQFDLLSEAEIDKLPALPLVIARCAPHTKVRMIEALHRRKAFVAMTGDGVNDSPSLKRADVGIAMGASGSDVAKDASSVILTDDNFASILNAIEEGRRMFDNIQKFVLHLLAENIAQACTLLIGLVFKDASGISVFPLAPVEVLWVIMITSGPPDMGLGMEVATANILDRPPQDLKRGVFTLELMVDMLVYGVWMSVLCLCAFSLVMFGFSDGELGEFCNERYSPACKTVFRARATTFACLTWFSLFLAWEVVDMRRSFFAMRPGSKSYLTQWARDVWRNKFLFWAVLAGFVTMFPTLYIPVINHDVFKHEGISWEWGIVFVEVVAFFTGCEAWKWAKRVFFRRRARKQGTRKVDLERKVFSAYLKNVDEGGGGEDGLSISEKGQASVEVATGTHTVEEKGTDKITVAQ